MKVILTEKQIKNLIQENIEELNYQSFQDDENLQELRDSIDKNKMVSVSFVKKDGEVKHMLVRKNLSSYVGSDREKTDAQMNVEMNHDLKKVVDINAYKRELKYLRNQNPEMDSATTKQMASKKAWRSINLKNVLGFMASGRFIDLRDENEIMDRFGETIYNSLSKSMINSLRPVADNPDNNEGEIDERSRSFAFTRKKRLFPRSAMMSNPNRFKEYDKEVKGINEEKTSEVFDEFADKRMGGAEKIANNAKEKGGASMLTYHHFIVKLPYYKEASEGKFDIDESKKEFIKTLKSISLNMNQTEFQREVGRLEVLGELIIKNKGI
jgi:hypothetical protein